MENIIDKLKNNNMLYFAIASLISADSNISVEEINENLKNLKFFKGLLAKSELMPEEKEKLIKVCEDGIEILNKDLLTFKKK